MLLFKRILNFTKSNVDASEQRGAERYTVGPAVQFTAVVNLLRHDDDGNLIARNNHGQDWPGRVTNLSTTGASIQLHSSAFAAHGETCRFKLSLEDYILEIPGKVVYFRSYPSHSVCGLSFEFDYFEVRKGYLQLLEPVAIGSSLAPVKAGEIKPDNSGYDREVYRGKDGAQLSVWREGDDGVIHSFDFRMNDYGVRWSTGMTELETYANPLKDTGKKPGRTPGSALTKAEHEEVSWLFCLAVPNLAKAVQADVRKFLATLIA